MAEQMNFADLLETLKPEIEWKITLKKNDKTIYRQKEKRYFEEISEEQGRMEIRRKFELATPSTIASLTKAITEDSDRLFDDSLFLTSRENIIGFKNGVFDLNTGKMRNYYSSDFVLMPLPHDIPERFDKETEEWFVNILDQWVGKDVGNWLCNTLAYMLFAYPNSENLWLNLFGSGANGKSVCIELLEKILGDDKVIGADLSAMSRFSGYDFQDKWLVVGRDSSSVVSESAISFIKNYTGDVKFRAEKKGGEAYDVQNPGKLIVSTNGLIQSKDRSYGWYRRLIPVPFPNQFPKNEKFKRGLFQELPKIIRVLLHRAYLYRHNDSSILGSVPDQVENLRRETRMMNDRLMAFWELYFYKDIDDGKGHITQALDFDKLRSLHDETMTTVYEVYKDWHAQEFGETAIEPSLKTFGGQYGAFLSGPAGKYYTYKKTRTGRKLELLPDFWGVCHVQSL